MAFDRRFNTVTSLEEKVGGLTPLRISMQEFNDCLNTCGLIHAPKTGLEFSWCSNRAERKRIVCNLDRAVFNDKWIDLYPSWGYKVGVRGISDHGVLYGAHAEIPKPKNAPFRALKVWKSHPDFLKIIKDSWQEEMVGNPGFIFMSKLKRLKKTIQLWNWNVFGDVRKKMIQAEDTVMQASLASDKHPMDIGLLNNIVTSKGVQEILTDQQKQITQQKSRVKWLKEGASNSRFFYVNLKMRQTQNATVELENANGNIVSNQDEIADILISHFEKKFKHHEVSSVPDFFQDIPKVVNEEDNFMLDATPTDEEVKKKILILTQIMLQALMDLLVGSR
ncbi:uncharacterized protein LOC113324870 [Papaver somniferum]|uniref:uncharacterized protein LOC113324870 n=1 Tax=Papaver somniferum TaxID=3469 RepID=UPI000E6F55D3|nr:uncharacterized protein LOC113324870 [Papaver somniferum]